MQTEGEGGRAYVRVRARVRARARVMIFLYRVYRLPRARRAGIPCCIPSYTVSKDMYTVWLDIERLGGSLRIAPRYTAFTTGTQYNGTTRAGTRRESARRNSGDGTTTQQQASRPQGKKSNRSPQPPTIITRRSRRAPR